MVLPSTYSSSFTGKHNPENPKYGSIPIRIKILIRETSLCPKTLLVPSGILFRVCTCECLLPPGDGGGVADGGEGGHTGVHPGVLQVAHHSTVPTHRVTWSKQGKMFNILKTCLKSK